MIASNVTSVVNKYSESLSAVIASISVDDVRSVVLLLCEARNKSGVIYICGNGGSAANAMHIANDLLYGASNGLKNKPFSVEALTSNFSVISCLANDVSYDKIFSIQLESKACSDDILIVLSGSGNSKNVIEAIIAARNIGMNVLTLTGYDGGKCKELSNVPVHFDVKDMQIAEDMQLIFMHMCMRILMTM
jgi:D-sedoheptulose 7-phosphate isomerase